MYSSSGKAYRIPGELVSKHPVVLISCGVDIQPRKLDPRGPYWRRLCCWLGKFGSTCAEEDLFKD